MTLRTSDKYVLPFLYPSYHFLYVETIKVLFHVPCIHFHAFVIHTLAAVIITLAFESPIIIVEVIIVKGGRFC